MLAIRALQRAARTRSRTASCLSLLARCAHSSSGSPAAAKDRPRQLEGKVAIITGAAGGIGSGICNLFAQNGAHLVAVDMRRDLALKAIETLGGEKQHMAVGVDVCDEKAVNDAVAAAVARFGKIDVLIANAGHQHIAPVHEFTYAEWRRMLAVHMDGTFLFTRAALRDMYAKHTKGKIIFMGSVHSKEASVLKSAYVAAKHGVLGFARAVSKEAGPHGVSVNVICPGFVRTPLVEQQIPQQAKVLGISEQDVVKNVMLVSTVDKEFTTREDVAQTALFLAAFPTNALTGQSINVSHGWRMD